MLVSTYFWRLVYLKKKTMQCSHCLCAQAECVGGKEARTCYEMLCTQWTLYTSINLCININMTINLYVLTPESAHQLPLHSNEF